MEPPIGPLLVSFHEIPAPRYPRGQRYPLAAMLAFVCGALRCGYRRDRASAAWGRCDGQKLGRALGLTRDQTPGAATLSHVLRQRGSPLGAAILGAWAALALIGIRPDN
jgi:hypothetical protein